MRQLRIEDWSRGSSRLHHLHATAKITVLLTFLLAVSTLRSAGMFCVIALAMLTATAIASATPLLRLFGRAATVLPFAVVFAALSLLNGNSVSRAELLIARSYLSACAALLLVATTPLPRLIQGLSMLRLPRFLLQVMQFVYRYLSVLTSEADAMRTAAASRAGQLRYLDFRGASATAGVLFARSWSRAETVHRAMVARGFDGQLPDTAAAGFCLADGVFTIAACAGIIGMRVALL